MQLPVRFFPYAASRVAFRISTGLRRGLPVTPDLRRVCSTNEQTKYQSCPIVLKSKDLGFDKDAVKIIRSVADQVAVHKIATMDPIRDVSQTTFVIATSENEDAEITIHPLAPSSKKETLFPHLIKEIGPEIEGLVLKLFHQMISSDLFKDYDRFKCSFGLLLYSGEKDQSLPPHRDDAYSMHFFTTLSVRGMLADIYLYDENLCPSANSYDSISPNLCLSDGYAVILTPFSGGVHEVKMTVLPLNMRIEEGLPYRLVLYGGIKGFMNSKDPDKDPPE